MNMQNLMAQAQKMKKDIEKKQEEINKTLFTGESGAFKVVLNGKKEIIDLKIDKNIIQDSDDIDALEDMIKIAFSDALRKIDKEIESKLGSYASGFNGLI